MLSAIRRWWRGGPVAQEINLRLREGRVRKKITFVTLGNAINQFFAAAKNSPVLTDGRFKYALAPEVIGAEFGEGEGKGKVEEDRKQFYWLDIISRLDPVALGKILDDKWIAQSKVTPGQIKRRLVINLDNPFRDHSFYFVNKALVVPRIARAINGGKYPWDSLAIGAAPGQRGGPSERVKTHIQKVGYLALLRIISAILIATYLVLAVFWLPVLRDKPLEWTEPGYLANNSSLTIYCKITNGRLYTEKYRNALEPASVESADPREQFKAEKLHQRATDCRAQSNFFGANLGVLLVTGVSGIVLLYLYTWVRRMLFLKLS